MKTIEIVINNECDLYEKYTDKVSKDLIKYLIREVKYTKDKVKVIIKTSVKLDNADKFIKDGLTNEYNDSKLKTKTYNNKQFTLFIIGIIFLIFSTFINYKIIKEVILIAGWVAIWGVIDISLNIDGELRINRKILKKLYNSEIEIKR